MKAAELRVGSPVKAYVLFVKAQSKIALTLNKKKARENAPKIDSSVSADSFTQKVLPAEDEVEDIKKQYASQIQELKSLEVRKYRVCETRSGYSLVKSIDANIKRTIAILPQALQSSFGLHRPWAQIADHSFECVSIGTHHGVPLVSAKPELITLKEEFNYEEEARQSFVGLVEAVDAKLGITIRFNEGKTGSVTLRQVPMTDQLSSKYPLGKLVRVALTKQGRLSLKRSHIEQADSGSTRRDMDALRSAFDKITTEQSLV